MALAVKRVRNLPPHLSYVSTPPDITQKRDIDELKQSFSDTWDRIPQGIIDEAARLIDKGIRISHAKFHCNRCWNF